MNEIKWLENAVAYEKPTSPSLAPTTKHSSDSTVSRRGAGCKDYWQCTRAGWDGELLKVCAEGCRMYPGLCIDFLLVLE